MHNTINAPIIHERVSHAKTYTEAILVLFY